jgi:ATP-dependent Lon protease
MVLIPKIFRPDNSSGDENQSPITLPLLPLRDIVVFPHMVSPLFVGRSKSINAISEAMNAEEKYILLSTQSDAGKETPKENEINRIGTIAKVLQMLRLPDGTVKTVVEGKHRARIVEFKPNESFFEVNLEIIEEPDIDQSAKEAFFRNISVLLKDYAQLNKNFSKDTMKNISVITDPVKMVYTVAGHFSFKNTENKS